MKYLLWTLQILLAVAFAAHGWMMVAPPPELAVIMNEQLGVAFRLLIGVAELLAAVGLILPGITGILPWLTPLASAGLSIVMVSATVLHSSRGETSSAITTAILLVLTLFVTYMRWQVKPIASRNNWVALPQ